MTAKQLVFDSIFHESDGKIDHFCHHFYCAKKATAKRPHFTVKSLSAGLKMTAKWADFAVNYKANKFGNLTEARTAL